MQLSERQVYLEKMKVRIHQQLVERLDVQNLRTVPQDQVRAEVRSVIRDLYQLEGSGLRYRFRLEGVDAGWVEAGPGRMAAYANLPAGALRFRVQGSNNDGLWNAIYVGAMVFRYAATRDPAARKQARQALDAMLELERLTGISVAFGSFILRM